MKTGGQAEEKDALQTFARGRVTTCAETIPSASKFTWQKALVIVNEM